MWTRRVLLATMVAACAMSLTRQIPAAWNVSLGGTPNLAVTSIR